MASTVSTTTTLAETSTTASDEASPAAAEAFLVALFDQKAEEAEVRAVSNLRIDFLTSSDSIDDVVSFAELWGFETLAVVCTPTNAAAARFGCEIEMTDDFSRVAPYVWWFSMTVWVSDGLVAVVENVDFIDIEVTVHDVRKTVSDWANEWLMDTYPEADANGCTPSPDWYCGAAFVAHAEEFWSTHPDIRAAVVAGG